MNKYFAAILTAIVAFVGLSPSASADMRLSLGVSRPIVVQGSETSVSVTETVNERSSYNWLLMKWELMLPATKGVELTYSISQSPQSPCAGSLSGSDSNVRICSGSVAPSTRTVFNGGINSSYINSARFSLTSKNGIEFEAGVRAWVDLNQDGEISPHEPVSEVATLQFISAKSFEEFIDFRADAPLVNASSTDVWLTTAEGFDGAGQNLLSMIDLNRLKLYSYVCTFYCVLTEFNPTFVSHPQLNAYRFLVTGLTGTPSSYAFRLMYQVEPDEWKQLAEQKFDYSARNLGSVETSMSGSGVGGYSSLGRPASDYQERWYQASLTSSTVSYKATVKDSKGLPLANYPVDLRVDLSQVKNSEYVLIDGRKILIGNRDQVWIKRKTNAAGMVNLSLANIRASHYDSAMVEIRVQGWRAWDLKGSGRSERTVWVSKTSNPIVLSGSSDNLDKSYQVRISIPVESNTAKLSGLSNTSQFPTVLASISEGLQVSHSLLKLQTVSCSTDAKTKVTSCFAIGNLKVRLENSIQENGSGTLKIRTIQNGKWQTATMKLFWRASDGSISTNAFN